MAQDESWWVGFLPSSADSSGSNIGVSNVGFYKQLSVPVFTVRLVSCCFCDHSPRSPIQFLCPLSTHPHAASISTAHSVSCHFSVYYPLSLVLLLCPLPAQSRAVSMFIAHSVSCYFCIHCPTMFKERCTLARKSRSSGWHSYFLLMRPQL